MDPSMLNQIPARYKPIYQQHWNTIRPSEKRGLLKDVYHFPLLSTSNEEIITRLQEVLTEYSNNVKVNIAFGFILYDRVTSFLNFFHPSNNTMLFDVPRLLVNPNDFQNLVNDIEHQDAVEYARSLRPSTKWTVERIICVRFDVFRLKV